MTENQRNYLADLAGQKGVRLHDTDNWTVAEASAEIERLKEMPDAEFDDITPAMTERVDKGIRHIIDEMNKWGFTGGRK